MVYVFFMIYRTLYTILMTAMLDIFSKLVIGSSFRPSPVEVSTELKGNILPMCSIILSMVLFDISI